MEREPTSQTSGKNWFRRHKVITTIAAIFIFGAVVNGLVGGVTDEVSEQNDQSASVSQSQDAVLEVEEPKGLAAGMYKIGSDMSAGEYRLISDTGGGYMQISSDSTGSFDSIIANANFDNNLIVSLKKGQYFKFDRARAYTMVESPKIDANQEGMFKVGKDIKAGEYKIESAGSGYVQVSSDSTHDMNSIVSNDNFEGSSYITVSNGQYLLLTRARIVE